MHSVLAVKVSTATVGLGCSHVMSRSAQSLEKASNCIDRVTILEFDGEWVLS